MTQHCWPRFLYWQNCKQLFMYMNTYHVQYHVMDTIISGWAYQIIYNPIMIVDILQVWPFAD